MAARVGAGDRASRWKVGSLGRRRRRVSVGPSAGALAIAEAGAATRQRRLWPVANKRLPKSVESSRRPSDERPLTEGAAKFVNAVKGRNAGARSGQAIAALAVRLAARAHARAQITARVVLRATRRSAPRGCPFDAGRFLARGHGRRRLARLVYWRRLFRRSEPARHAPAANGL